MIRLILMTDFTENYAYRLLKGILKYAQGHEPWVVCRMPRSYKDRWGLVGVLKWAKKWEADAIIAQFEDTDDVEMFAENGIIALAQDYKSRFKSIPNITGDYIKTGQIAAEFFINKGFRNFAFYGYEGAVWSQERFEGFRDCIIERGFGSNLYDYQKQSLNNLWSYESQPLLSWIKSLPQNTAMFCCDDTQANRISEVCRANGIRIPEDVAILGVDNDKVICNLSEPTLSSVKLSISRGGFEAARLIDRLIKDEIDEGYDIQINASMVVDRQSTDIYSTDDPYILNVLKYIHRNITKKLSVEELVSQVPLSRRLLEIRFKVATKMTIYKYIMNLKMDKFSHLITSSRDSIFELAEQMGFDDYGNLSRQFKQYKGCSPSEFRRKYGAAE